ncbi:MAG: hypothetical protein IJ654_04745 [Bacteroidales bacterium]|nr:hypothetical protein [Bacteroidales bacterium]
MRRRNILVAAVILLSMIPMVSCEKVKKPVPGEGMKRTYIFYPRECKVVDVLLIERSNSFPLCDSLFFSSISRMQLQVGEIHRTTGPRVYTSNPFGPEEGEVASHDLGIENKVMSVLNEEYERFWINYYAKHPDKFGHHLNSAPTICYEYRTEELEDLVISANKPLFGMQPGTRLNDYIWMAPASQEEQFLFSPDGRYLDRINGLKLQDYLAYSPMCLAAINLFLESVPPEAPVEGVRFTVEVKIKGKEPMRATTKAVTIVP